MPVRTPRGSACMGRLPFGLGVLPAVDGEVGAIHATQVATATFLRGDDVRWVVALGVEDGREAEDLGGAELDTERAALAALDVDANVAFCHSVVFQLTGGTSARRVPKGNCRQSRTTEV